LGGSRPGEKEWLINIIMLKVSKKTRLLVALYFRGRKLRGGMSVIVPRALNAAQHSVQRTGLVRAAMVSLLMKTVTAHGVTSQLSPTANASRWA
jgi:hypothetical protein